MLKSVYFLLVLSSSLLGIKAPNILFCLAMIMHYERLEPILDRSIEPLTLMLLPRKERFSPIPLM